MGVADVLELSFTWTFGILGGAILGFVAIVFILCMANYILKELF